MIRSAIEQFPKCELTCGHTEGSAAVCAGAVDVMRCVADNDNTFALDLSAAQLGMSAHGDRWQVAATLAIAAPRAHDEPRCIEPRSFYLQPAGLGIVPREQAECDRPDSSKPIDQFKGTRKRSDTRTLDQPALERPAICIPEALMLSFHIRVIDDDSRLSHSIPPNEQIQPTCDLDAFERERRSIKVSSGLDHGDRTDTIARPAVVDRRARGDEGAVDVEENEHGRIVSRNRLKPRWPR